MLSHLHTGTHSVTQAGMHAHAHTHMHGCACTHTGGGDFKNSRMKLQFYNTIYYHSHLSLTFSQVHIAGRALVIPSTFHSILGDHLIRKKTLVSHHSSLGLTGADSYITAPQCTHTLNASCFRCHELQDTEVYARLRRHKVKPSHLSA